MNTALRALIALIPEQPVRRRRSSDADVLLRREPHYQTAALLLAAAEQGGVQGYLCTTSLTTIYCFVARQLGATDARQVMRRLLQIFTLAAADRLVFEAALLSQVIDFEDAVLCEAAYYAELNGIVTRNGKDFRHSPIEVFSPEGLASWLARQDA